MFIPCGNGAVKMEDKAHLFKPGCKGGPGRTPGLVSKSEKRRILIALKRQALKGSGHAALCLQQLGVSFVDANP